MTEQNKERLQLIKDEIKFYESFILPLIIGEGALLYTDQFSTMPESLKQLLGLSGGIFLILLTIIRSDLRKQALDLIFSV